MRVLVTGAYGFVGTALVRRLAASGHEVRALTSRPAAADDADDTASADNEGDANAAASADDAGDAASMGDANAEPRARGRAGQPGVRVFRGPGIRVFHGDVRDPESMRRAVDGVDAVCHLAALTSVRAARDRAAEYWAVNHGGAVTVARAAAAEARARKRAVRFVLASTGAVYGQPELQPIPEDLPFLATNEYGETKRAAERDVLGVPADGRFGAVALRLFNVAGASGGRTGDPDTLIPKTLAVARGDAPCLRINGDGSAVRDFVHVDDAARAFERALAHADPDRRAVFNVGATGASVLDVVRVAREVTGHPIPVTHLPSRGEARMLLADTGRARAVLGWRPRRSGLSTLVADAWHALR